MSSFRIQSLLPRHGKVHDCTPCSINSHIQADDDVDQLKDISFLNALSTFLLLHILNFHRLRKKVSPPTKPKVRSSICLLLDLDSAMSDFKFAMC
jgi:hypothetical protein